MGAPPRYLLPPLSIGEEFARLGQNDVVGIAQTGGKDAQRCVGRQDRLVQAVVAAEWPADIETARSLVTRRAIVGYRRVVERRQVVFLGAGDAGGVGEGLVGDGLERHEVDLEHGGGQRVFRRVGEEVEGAPLLVLPPCAR